VRTAARFPSVPRSRGHYESFYLKASAPEGGRALWLRHTFHRRPGAAATAAIWLTWFDSARERPLALKHGVAEALVSVPDGSYVRVDGAEIAPGRATGEVEGASWSLRFSDRHDPLRHLPAEWMYGARLPRTKLLSPHPGALFDGVLEIDGERVVLDEWPGMVGHNWGAEHAESWVWIQGAGLAGAGADDYLDIAAGRVRVGPLLTPWIANGRLVLDGRAHRLGGIGALRGTSIDASPTHCRFTVPGDGVAITGDVGTLPERTVGWLYADPGGGEHNAFNSSIADLEVVVGHAGGEPRRLRLEGGAAHELGTAPGDHGVPIEPHPDG
jgi:hypothetical protein